MKFWTFASIVLGLNSAFAFNSTMSLSLDELKKNDAISTASAGDDKQIPLAAARVIQLQLRAVGCSAPVVMPSSLHASSVNDFQISSDDCSVKSKKTETCDSGYGARNMLGNPYNKGDTIVGGDSYKVCIKSPQGGGQALPTKSTTQ